MTEEIKETEYALSIVQRDMKRSRMAESVELPIDTWMYVLQLAEAGLKARLAYEKYKSEYGVSVYNWPEALEKITNEFWEMGCILPPKTVQAAFPPSEYLSDTEAPND